MKNLPNRIFLNLRHTWQVKKGNKCLPNDFNQLRDDCGECITHTLGDPNHEDDPEYILNDKGAFVPGEWGIDRWGNVAGDCDYEVSPHTEEEGFWVISIWDTFYESGMGKKVCHELYSGPLTPTLFRLIAEANGIPLPESK